MSALPPDDPQISDDPSGHAILVVDDEVRVRLVIAEHLRNCGYRVHEAANADEAIAVLQTRGVTIDLVFSDVEMPGGSMDGFALAQWVRVHHPEVKVMLTSGAARSARLAADLCEAGPLLHKPYAMQEVVDRIRRLLAAVRRDGRDGDAKAVCAGS